MNKQEVEKLLVPLTRKYDWEVLESEEGNVLSLRLNDGNHVAQGVIKDKDGLESLVKGLEKKLDEQDYTTLG